MSSPETIWVPGANGMLGSAVAAALERQGYSVLRTDIELRIDDPQAVEQWLSARDVSHVINCAAYTRVDDAEDHVAEAHAANARGPEVLAEAAASQGAVFVHYSTDYVFDGNSERPYQESDACAPLAAYGRSKRQGELAIDRVLRVRPEFLGYIVRTSWLFGEGGPNFPNTMLRLFRERRELRVVADQVGRPTYAKDLAQATLELLRLVPGTKGRARPERGVYHFANEGVLSWHAFATAILASALARGFPTVTERIESILTAAYPTKAVRPRYSVLDTSKIEAELPGKPRAWSVALEDFMGQVSPLPSGER